MSGHMTTVNAFPSPIFPNKALQMGYSKRIQLLRAQSK